MADEGLCKHCGQRVVERRNWAGRVGFTHQPEGASFQDYEHRFCERTVAAPREICGEVKIDRPYLAQGSTYEVYGGKCIRLPNHNGDHDYQHWVV
ncbi:hypothetical protein TPA2_gp13 [Tsukamurella phage TPA2]|uniref:hypothetical protein n=1 Tax=Tsukamurella phage TPA2 TaxID=981330 RepID=UPI0001FF8DA4|nr:hypothetical protein TPA2_gp13 [Tsukamurella phage TPA2]ADX31927.1 hypothetical protein [Tsukamurella phage TPA2]